jgi:hypothetical protein
MTTNYDDIAAEPTRQAAAVAAVPGALLDQYLVLRTALGFRVV